MPGNQLGGIKAAQTNIQRYGNNFYKHIGAKGGLNGRTGGFASDKVGEDGLTGKQRAKIAGKLGGTISRRGPVKDLNEYA